jgi:hypothetical protein
VVEQKLEERLGGQATVSKYLVRQLELYREKRCGDGKAVWEVTFLRQLYRGVYIRKNRPAWVFDVGPGGSLPPATETDLDAACAAAELGGDWEIATEAHESAEVSYNHLLAELFQFPVTGHIKATAFDVEAIGRQRYNVARASLQRACARLEQRQLISRISDSRGYNNGYSHFYERAGIMLTKAGQGLADSLLEADPVEAAA